ncbi:MAG: DUF1801 domain-containing protein [Calditrichaeota bacterium]|nr:DUF1801 domain-containing protein [Calditrichota bacterium]
MDKEILKYNRACTTENRAICDQLLAEISAGLPEAESKLWHGSPVWFLEGNPIVGYHVLKNCVRLLFWSGQSFAEKGLQPEGKFKAAEVRFTEAAQINSKDVQKWLKKSRKIQWDYKNIVKRKGELLLLSGDAGSKQEAVKSATKTAAKTKAKSKTK